MPEKKKRKTLNVKDEELRALFVLGVLATLLAGQQYYQGMSISFGILTMPVKDLVNIILLTWGSYAFFMVFALSKDIFPKFINDFSRTLSIAFLYVGSFLLAYISLFLFIFGFIFQIHLIILMIIPFILLFVKIENPFKNILINLHIFTNENFYHSIEAISLFTWIIFFAIYTVNLFKVDVTIFVSKDYIEKLPFLSFFSGMLFVFLYKLRQKYKF
jgi:hypothetical protein